LGPLDVTIYYQVQTYGVGLYLTSLSLDYSHLALQDEVGDLPIKVDLLTASLVVKKLIFTASCRREDSQVQAYNPQTKALKNQQLKTEYFGGVQFTVTKNIMVGALYNYYLLHEFSGALTLFF
jgi:hypothetical protein